MSVEVSQALLCLQRRDDAADERVRRSLEVLREAGHVDQFDHARLEYALLTNDPAVLRWAIEGLSESLVSVCVASARLARLEGQPLDVANLEATLEAALAAENFAELPLGYELLAHELETRGDAFQAARMRERARSVNLECAAGLPKLQRTAFLQLEA
ncbi:MAG: hypothetical protein HC933_15825 [Pleurocapsa sp. SU_196_0]|nr:hypothetical protein [Pleurocapsa sp. SU_196_0]